MRKCYVMAAALATALGLPTAALAAEAATVVRDAETGQLRAPTAEEARVLREKALRLDSQREASRTTGPREVRHKDGTVEMQLDSSSMMYTVAQRHADGSITRACVQGEEQAKAAADAPRSFAKPLRAPVSTPVARTARGAIYELQ